MIETTSNDQSSLKKSDQQWMERAIQLAIRAEHAGEVPVGAIVVQDGIPIGEGWNQPIAHHDPTAHAEIIALRAAGQTINNYRLLNSTLYVTLEPCIMCLGAMAHARIKRLVFGATDPKRGAVCSALALTDADFLNHTIEWRGGLLEAPCRQLLKAFFARRR